MKILPLLVSLGCLAVAAATASGQSLDEARDLVSEGRTEAAIEMFQRVAETSPDVADRATAHNNACVLRMRLGDYAAALEQCLAALPLRRQLDDARRLARGLNNTGLALQSLGRTAEAVAMYEEAMEINRHAEDWLSVVINLSNLGLLRTQLGEYRQAGRALDEALDLCEEQRHAEWAVEQRQIARINQGVLLERVGAFREALELYEVILQDSGDLTPAHRAQLESNRGVLLRNLGDPLRAVAAFEAAIEEFSSVGDTAGLSNGWLNLGLAHYLNLGQLGVAEAAFRRALAFAEESGDRGEEIQDLYYLGRILTATGALDEAEEILLRCQTQAEASQAVEGQWLALEGLGRLSWRRGELQLASQQLIAALELVEATRQELRDDRWRSSYLQQQRGLYSAAVEVQLARHQEQPTAGHGRSAWEIVQRARARQLLEALRLDDTATTLSSGISLEEVLAQLDGAVLLEVFVGTSQLYAWTLIGGSLTSFDLGPAAPTLAKANQVTEQLRRGQNPTADDLASLSAVLLAQTGVLAETPERLVVVADGALRRLPFELLSSEGQQVLERLPVSHLPSAALFVRPRPAVVNVEAPPGTVLESPVMGLAFANPSLPSPAFDLSDDVSDTASRITRVDPTDALRRRFRLPPLPAAESEVAAIRRLIDGSWRVLKGEEATEEAYRQLAPRAEGVLHFAAHSLVDERPGGMSAILLSPQGQDDGLLSAQEIASTKLSAPLTVLSSCRSALGDVESNGALASLSGAFLVAGSSAVVATLWDVDDQASQVFMEQFYYQLERGLPVDEALRQAKRRLASDARWNRPSLWSAYVVLGDGSLRLQAAPAKWRVWAISVGFLVVLIFVTWRRVWRSSRG